MASHFPATARRTSLGVLLLLIGGILLLNNLDLLPESLWWLPRWYTLIMAIGLFNVVVGNRSSGVILLIIGGIFLLGNIGLFRLNWSYIWPLLIMMVGLIFIFRSRIISNQEISTEEDFFDVTSLLGGSKQVVQGSELRGGRVTSILGGSEIDLRNAGLRDGAEIEIFTLFGGTEILVPREWRINAEVSSILGGFENKRSDPAQGPILRIKGMTILGGGEVKS